MALFGNKKGAVPEIPTNSSAQNNQPMQFPEPSIAQATKEPTPLPEPLKETIKTSTPTFPSPNNSQIPQVTKELSPEQRGNHEQPFFVRIDKFTETRENFNNVNIKVQEMEQILENLEKIKEEEEKELDSWKEEINEMKSYLNDIDKEIFSKI